MTIIGDVHGCYETLMRLIEQLPDKENICFVGDLIDRGPNSCKVVEFVKNGGYPCVMGNHEELMIEYIKNYGFEAEMDSVFLNNGGDFALKSYGLLDNADENGVELFLEHLRYMKTLPPYILFDEIKDDEGLTLLASHAPIIDKYGLEAIDGDYCRWNRKMPSHESSSFFNVFGHNIVRAHIVKKSWAAIDTGCFYGDWRSDREFGVLSAIEFPSKRVFAQRCVDMVEWRPISAGKR